MRLIGLQNFFSKNQFQCQKLKRLFGRIAGDVASLQVNVVELIVLYTYKMPNIIRNAPQNGYPNANKLRAVTIRFIWILGN